MNSPQNPNNRAISNVILHENIMPKYAVTYIPDPFWILDIQRHEKLKPNLTEIILRSSARCSKSFRTTFIER